MTPEGRKLWFKAAAVVVVLAGVWFIQWAVQGAGQELRRDYLGKAELTARTIEHHRLEGLTGGPADAANPEYQRLKEQLAAARELYPGSAFLYLLGQQPDGRLFFLVDSEPAGSPDESQPGQIYAEATPGLLAAFAGCASLCEGPTTDQWGRWVSALVPIIRPEDGHMVAMLGIDFNAAGHTRWLVRAGAVPCLIMLLSLAALGAGQHLLSRRHGLAPGQNCRLKHIEALLALILGVLLSTGGAWSVQRNAAQRTAEGFRNLAELETEHVLRVFEVIQDFDLAGLATFFQSSQQVDREEFHEFSHHLLRTHTLQAIGWVPAADSRDPHQAWRLAFLEPEVDPGALGDLDLGEDPNLHVRLEEARQTGLPVLAPAPAGFARWGLGGTQLAFIPVSSQADPDLLQGFGLAVISPEHLLSLASGPQSGLAARPQIQLSLSSLDRNNGTATLATTRDETPPRPGDGPEFTRPVFMFGQTFAVTARPTTAFLENNTNRAPWIALLAGLLLTGAIAVNIGLVVRDQATLEAQVRERTATLRASEDRFRGVAESMADWIWEVDPEGRYTFCSHQVEHVLGYPPGEMLGKTPFAFMEPEEASRVQAIFLPFLQKQEPLPPLENWNLTRDGRRVCLQTKGVPIFREDGEFAGYLGVDTDITEQKIAQDRLLQMNRELGQASVKAREMAERAERANAAKSEFLANMSHEIRTPMNGVIGMTGLLLDTRLDDEQRRYAETVRTSSESLLNIVNDILDFSKIEAGKLEMEVLDFDLAEVMEEFADTMAYRVFQKDLEFTCSVAPETPLLLQGDPGRLRQVLTNLTGNSVKFTRQGSIGVRAELVEHRRDAALIRFSVRDTGIGIPAEKTATLFDKFTQVDASTTREYGGTGLGLAISRELAEAMGGAIGVESRVGQGTTFWFTACFPLRPAACPDPDHGELAGARVLVAAPDPDSRLVLGEMLERLGTNPTSTSEAEPALDLLRRAAVAGQPFRALILDARTLERGVAPLQAILARDPALEKVALIVLTAPGSKDQQTPPVGSGRAVVLSKPLRLANLRSALLGALAPGAAQPTAAPAAPRLAAFADQGSRILLVEDNLVNQKVALGLLKKLGLKAEVAANGSEAIEALGRAEFDLVFMDCQMPVMDGYEATRRIRDPRSQVRDHGVTIIAMTANAMKGDREKCLLAGMDDYLPKPVKPDALAAALQKWLPVNSSCNT